MAPGDGSTSASTYDAEVQDMLRHSIYTRDRLIRGSLDGCPDGDDHSKCKEVGACPGVYFAFAYIDALGARGSSTTAVQLDDGGETQSLEPMPSSPVLFDKYYEYFSAYVFDGTRGEKVVNLCKKDTKSPVFDVPGCVVAKRSSKPSSSYPSFWHRDCYWVPLVSGSAVSSIIDSLNDIDIRPMPSTHDVQSYGGSRVLMKRKPTTCQLRSCDWDDKSDKASICRFLPCDAVATATFTVSILLKPYPRARGIHPSKVYMSLVLHNIK